jgi:hypothetical protein
MKNENPSQFLNIFHFEYESCHTKKIHDVEENAGNSDKKK